LRLGDLLGIETEVVLDIVNRVSLVGFGRDVMGGLRDNVGLFVDARRLVQKVFLLDILGRVLLGVHEDVDSFLLPIGGKLF
jgi:hypothetical protein